VVAGLSGVVVVVPKVRFFRAQRGPGGFGGLAPHNEMKKVWDIRPLHKMRRR
jgi:hypothetical protein